MDFPVTRQLIFQGLKDPWGFAGNLIAIILAMVLIVWLFQYERLLVRRSVGATLLGLRFTVLIVILITFLQPVLGWVLDRNAAGRIVVAVDVSESMSLTDPSASIEEKLRWARGLGMISREASERWIAEARSANQEPSTATDASAGRELNRTLELILKDVDQLSRREMTRRVLLETPAPLLKALEPLGQVDVQIFGGAVLSGSGENPGDWITAPPTSVRTDVTDLSVALQPNSAESNSSQPVRGIILLTDGRDTSKRNPLMAASALKSGSTPVYPILFGSTNRAKDLSVVTLEFPQTVYKGDKPKLKVVINTSGFEGKPVVVELGSKQEDGPSQRKTVIGTTNYATVEFDLDGNRIGRRDYEIRIPVQPEELRIDNNGRSFAYQVVDDRAQVMLVDGGARWEFRFLETTLSRDDRISLRKVLIEQPFLGALDAPFFPREIDWPADLKDETKSPFATLDLLILGDIPPVKWSEPQWQLVEQFVSDGGGTLILSAGKKSFPLAHRSPTLEKLLPFHTPSMIDLNLAQQSQSGPTERGLEMKLTAEGTQQAALQFSSEEIENARIWQTLPGPLWAINGETKPAATNWVESIGPRGTQTPLPKERRGLVIHQNYGLGQVIWIGFDSTWRWRNLIGDERHHRFWAQLARAAAANKVSGGNEFVRFGADRSDIEQGDDAILRAKWTPSFLQRYPKLKAKVEVLKFEEGVWKPYSQVDLIPEPNRPLVALAKAATLPNGQYLARLSAPEIPELNRKPIEAPLHVQPRFSSEISELSANRVLLEQLATATDGRLFQLDELEELPKQFHAFEAKSRLQQETSLWDHWFWLVLLFALLTTEWTIRKWNGLP